MNEAEKYVLWAKGGKTLSFQLCYESE